MPRRTRRTRRRFHSGGGVPHSHRRRQVMNSGMSPGNNVAKSYYDNMPWGHGPAPIPMRPARGGGGGGNPSPSRNPIGNSNYSAGGRIRTSRNAPSMQNKLAPGTNPTSNINKRGGNNTVTGWYWPNHITPPTPTNRPGSRMRRGGRTRRMRRGGRTRRR